MNQGSNRNPSVFFPEEMEYIEIICPLESAYYAIKEIASAGNVELIDLQSKKASVDKRYTEQYLKCEEAERSIRYFEQQLTKFGLLTDPPIRQDILRNIETMNLQEITGEIHEIDRELHEKVTNFEQLNKVQITLNKKLQLLRFYKPLILSETQRQEEKNRTGTSGLGVELLSFDTALIHSVTGFIPTAKLHHFENTIYRLSRRNAIFNIGDQIGDETPYTIFCHSETISNKILKVAESYTNDVYEFPSDSDSIFSLEQELVEHINQGTSILYQTQQFNLQYLQSLATRFWDQKTFITREKQIYGTIDFGDFERVSNHAVYCGWIPTRFVGGLPAVLQNATAASGSPVPINLHTAKAEESNQEIVPTFIETNEFTYPFQMLNDAYGTPSYGELNGGAFYCMYPFLFAIMFGDIGHSFFYILASIGLFIFDAVLKRSGSVTEMGKMISSFKWIVLIASLCSLYTGFLYNECFGVPIDMWGSQYEPHPTLEVGSHKVSQKISNRTYPFGIDPVWMFKDNELIFLNSFKMKLSIVMGMTQMVFGVILSLINHLKKRNWSEIFTTWVPNVLYLVPFFGYLVIIIIVKWFQAAHFDNEHAPNLIQVMISMILPGGTEQELYKGQQGIQKVIVIIFFASIPMCLFMKPLYQIFKNCGNKEFSILEAFVMNLIHVIEFCLSALSHTASYLRLWALSLAHSQLSHVLWDELILMPLKMENKLLGRIIMPLAFMGFEVLTVAILLGMEAFSALLHAIRLMWVEFSSKFYEGTGVPFNPVSLTAVLNTVGLR